MFKVSSRRDYDISKLFETKKLLPNWINGLQSNACGTMKGKNQCYSSASSARPRFETYIHNIQDVFVKYCVFSEDFKIFLSLFSLGVSVCTHTRQVEHQRCSRTFRVQKNHNILRKNTIFNEHPVSPVLMVLNTVWTHNTRVFMNLQK